MALPEMLVQPLHNGLRSDAPFCLDVLVRVQAPDSPEEGSGPRSPLHLAVVLDRSGSMSGRPLEEAKRCAAAIIERLQPADRVALVAYDNYARVVHPLATVTDRNHIRRSIEGIRSGGNTNLHLGWVTGLKQLQDEQAPGVISRILLLSDGQANAGVVEPEQLAEEAGKALGMGVGTSTYGLGERFEEGLMAGMAKAGQGRAYYGETAEDLLDPFMEEFDLLSNLFARKLVVSLRVPPGVQVTQLNNHTQAGALAWNLPELAYGAEAWGVFRLEGDPATLASWVKDGTLGVAGFALSFLDSKGQAASLPAQNLALPLLEQAAFEALERDLLVERRVGELRAAAMQDRAYQACLEGDWKTVHQLLDELRELVKDNPWTQASLDQLVALATTRQTISFSKEVYYSSRSLESRLAEKLERPNRMGSDSADGSSASYTRRKPRRGKGDMLPPTSPTE